jgi:threonine aldolase
VNALVVDLRSDTVTKPSAAMRRAMADAEVGDDWFGDDPTVNRLQERAAEAVSKEAALYVPTGTMANQIGLRLHFRGTGHLVLAEASAHVSTTEVMSSAALSGMAFRGLRGDRRGQITPEQVGACLAPDPEDVEVVDVVAVEDTHGHAGGRVMAMDDLRGITKLAREHDLPVHLDGARIFNASVASGTPVAEIAAEADTVMFCVSKGLGAPIGSLVCGPAELMREARRMKVLFGGAWRQAGVVAAAGLVALEEGPKRLHEDHERAGRLAEGIAEVLPGVVDPWMLKQAWSSPTRKRWDWTRSGDRAAPGPRRRRDVRLGKVGWSPRRHRDEDLGTALAAWRAVAADR